MKNPFYNEAKARVFFVARNITPPPLASVSREEMSRMLERVLRCGRQIMPDVFVGQRPVMFVGTTTLGVIEEESG